MPEPEKDKMTIVVFSGEMDKAMAAFIIANTGASMGMQVTMFFTWWGLNIIKRNDAKSKSRGFIRRMMSLMNRGGSRRLKLTHFNMLGIGTGMIKRLMKQTRYPTIDDFIEQARELGVRMVPCSTTCGLLGVDKESFISQVEEIAGAAYFLNEARQSKVSLFI